jgi:hypothetical protein
MKLNCKTLRQHNVNFIAKKATMFPFWLRYNTILLYFHPKTNL